MSPSVIRLIQREHMVVLVENDSAGMIQLSRERIGRKVAFKSYGLLLSQNPGLGYLLT